LKPQEASRKALLLKLITPSLGVGAAQDVEVLVVVGVEGALELVALALPHPLALSPAGSVAALTPVMNAPSGSPRTRTQEGLAKTPWLGWVL
jgi:hypothetical protein